jgi:hypothetical protein
VVTTRVKVEGVDAWAKSSQAMLARLDVATAKATDAATHWVERVTKLELVRLGHPRGTPTPSPPGTPPARIDGHLARSVNTTPARRVGAYRWEGKVGPTAAYGRIQELGGQAGRNHTATLPPRPYLKPTTLAERPAIRREYVEHWRDALHGPGR